MGSTIGCYSYRPVSTASMSPGMHVAVALSDQGRVSLADALGPAVESLEGEILNHADSVTSLRVARVTYINGTSSRWNGELLRVAPGHAASMQERRFSRHRTVALAATTIGALIALGLSVDLFGFGGLGREGPERPGPDQ